MNHWIIVPAILPALVAAFLILTLRHHLVRQRIVSVTATLLLLAVAAGLFAMAIQGEPVAYRLGDWPAPYGIVLVLDRLSATMLLLTAVLALVVVIFVIDRWDTRGRYFHILFQFQLLGINGAFLTGDLFNLFVFFEVMLIASYGLMLHGGGAARLKAGFQYVAINLVASALFLIAVGLIYAVTGTLNLADLALKVPEVAPSGQAILKTGALLLFLVFAIKAALVPLHWWLPATYSTTSAPAAALFMIMTKVGAYAILRVFGLVFGADAGPLAMAAAPILLPAALVTLLAGSIGLVGSRTLSELAAYAVIASMGTLLIAVGLFDQAGVTAALYYLVHSTLAGAALFLLAGLIAERRGQSSDQLVPAPAITGETLLSSMFFAAAVAMVGLPPLAGFLGKVMILQAVAASSWWPAVWAVILGTSLLMTLGFARAGSTLFWASEPARIGQKPVSPARLPTAAVALLLFLAAAWTVGAGPLARILSATATQALDRIVYITAVLGPDAAMAGR
ncbi:MAG TPA: monovalent cation/H+ antiporter subunit D [Geminicoccus sp.]|jgi:multicomponent K+:H+ antiporter subunit D|uniref:monovalent cation/H+ antiporter subunit D n=1 Tax=Geminicoccus sp. TaxID=2024832 RepID=UPI002E3815A1|nr:monovalent cation/H+ antiporter subunit D [Geminicoccus sp.]HEX2525562.1 monovalent cation/H+ antiporter subunit D [Geminicoccus sp.]